MMKHKFLSNYEAQMPGLAGIKPVHLNNADQYLFPSVEIRLSPSFTVHYIDVFSLNFLKALTTSKIIFLSTALLAVIS